MKNDDKTQWHLIHELAFLRRRVAELEACESKFQAAADALNQSEARFRKLSEKSVVGVYLVQDNRFRYVNPEFAKIFGYRVDEVIDELAAKAIVFPEDWPLVDRNLRKRLSGEVESIHFSYRGVTKDGETIHVEAYGSGMDYNGRPAVIGTLLDVTERKRNEEALRKSQEQYRELYEESETRGQHYRTLLDASPEPIVVYDAVGIPEYVNPAFTRVFGWTYEELQGKRIDFVPPENWPETNEMIRKVLNGERFSDEETRRYTKDGRIIDVSVSGAIFFDRRGNRTGSVVHLRDITARKRAEACLAAELSKFHALYDLAVAMIAERSLDDNLALVAEKARQLLAVDKAFIALQDEFAGDLYMHTLSGIVTEDFKKVRIPLGAGLGGKVAQTGQSCIVEDYFQETGPEFHDIVRAEGLFSGIAVPVQIGQTNLGVLYAFNRTKTPFSKSDLDALSLLGNLAAVEITRKRAQHRLRLSEESFRLLYEESRRREELYVSLLNSSADAIVIYDMEGRAQYVNPAFTQIFGWTIKEVEGKRIPFLPESERETSMVIIQRIIRDGTSCSGFETKRYTKDGRLLDISISASRCRDHEGNPAGMLVILRNITDRKRAETDLRESEERFRTLAEMAPFGLVVVDRGGKAEYVNPKFTEIFGYALDEVPHTDTWLLKVYREDNRRIMASALWKEETERLKAGDTAGREAMPRLFSVRSKDGTKKIINFRGVVLADGRVIATFLDVTAEATAQEEILRAKNEWERTFHAVSDLIMILDGSGRIVRANRAVAQRLGIPAEGMIGLACHDAVNGDRSLASLCAERALADGKEHATEVTDESLGGVFDLRVSPLRDEKGRLLGSVHVARDITAFKSMEQARRLAVHHLSHELKTPLAIVKGSVKDLDSPDLAQASRQTKVERIRRSLERLGDIQHTVQEIVAPHEYRPRYFPLIPTIQEIVEKQSAKSSHRSVRLVERLAPVATDAIDPDVFTDVLGTLLKNAIENTPDEGEIVVSLDEVAEGILLKVEDRGVGIAASDRDFVFEAFHHTQDTDRYSTRNPFDFDAGGKGLELMRLKILAEEGAFDISFESRRCRYLPSKLDRCPGRISLCEHVSDVNGCRKSGGTTFSILFRKKAVG